MVSDDIIRDLLRQSKQGFESEPTIVLADALLETDRPDLGEDLALILAGLLPFPREQRGQPFVTLYGRSLSREGALKVVFRRIDRRFAWSPYDEEERRRGLRELDEIEKNWNASSSRDRADEIARVIDWLEEDFNAVYRGGFSDSTLLERATWLIDGTMGRGAQILAEEMVDAPLSARKGRVLPNREAQLFRLVLAFDDLLPSSATNRVWDGLSADGKRYATATIRKAIVENGGEVRTPTPRAARSRRPR